MAIPTHSPQTETHWVSLFAEGDASMRDLLGGKGAGVAEMTRLGLPVPPGFTITTAAYRAYEQMHAFPPDLWDQVLIALKTIEVETGKHLGDPVHPLLISVRSGAPISMPGMLDTVLNLGLNETTVQALATLSGDTRFAYDAYRRFIQMYAKIVMDVPAHLFEEELSAVRTAQGVTTDAALASDTMRQLVITFLQLVATHAGQPFPTDPYEQLHHAIAAVFDSWHNPRAIAYRTAERIPHEMGTAVTIQTMVFGNLGATSGTGVAFTRDPNTGEKRLYAEYLPTAQGEDVVAGIRTPYPISYLAEELPAVYTAFITCAAQLEAHYRDVQDLEFTVEQGRLYLLQTRSAKRTAAAAVTIAVALANEGVIRREEAVQRITPTQVTQLLLSRFAPDAKSQAEVQGDLLTTGLNASPGAAYGAIVFDAATAAQRGQTGERVILVRPETSPDDVEGMLHAAGILTARGGATSHAAVVARGLGLPCVAGCADILVDELSQTLTVRGTTTVLRAGDMLSLDGATGEVFRGLIATIAADYSQEQDLHILLGWADTLRTLNVWANADTPRDAARAIQYGAQGIGLCRTEHMFFAPDRLPWVQQMILAATVAERQVALAHLLPIQQEDFVGLFEEMRHPETHMAYPVVIRLMDPPLHEFLPQREEVEQHIATLAQQPDQEAELAEQRRVLAAIERLHEVNPMLGLRGCRLGLLYPEITTMQVRAILQAAAQVQATGQSVSPKIMIPLVGHVNELIEVRRQIAAIASAVETETGQKVAYQCGTMIEVPRAALTAGAIGTAAEFFSFGTNDLTQMTCGISRDDAEGTFLLKYVAGLPQRDVTGQPLYTDAGQERTVQIWSNNPFQTLDQEGVGQLVQMAVVAGRAANPALEIGICGEHGGDPASIAFFATVGVDYVSCSPFRVPVARLAAAQAQLLVTV